MTMNRIGEKQSCLLLRRHRRYPQVPFARNLMHGYGVNLLKAALRLG